MRIYRVMDGKARLLRATVVARYLASAASGYRILLEEAGPVVQAGDVYFLSLIRDDLPAELLPPRLRHVAGVDTWRIYPNGGDGADVTTRRDAGSVGPEHGSRTSMRIAIPGATEGGVHQYLTGSAEQQIFNAFEPGRTYLVELWLRQQDVEGGEVAVWLAPYRGTIGRSFHVSGAWGAYQFTFRAPRRLPRGALTALHITFRGPGTLWVDDVQLSDTRRPAYAIRPEVSCALVRGPCGSGAARRTPPGLKGDGHGDTKAGDQAGSTVCGAIIDNNDLQRRIALRAQALHGLR